MTFWDHETLKPALTWSKAKQKWEPMPAPFQVFLAYFGDHEGKDRFYAAFWGKGRFL